MKKLFILSLCFILAVSPLGIVAYAQPEAAGYPYVFVHGMCGWGAYSELEQIAPYWGISQENNIMTLLQNDGVECYAATVGGLSSAWDRACELYAQLAGTVVDYGAAHAAEHNHARFGRSYEGRALMGRDWDLSTINIVGHSFGGATVRYFVSLLYYGDEAEKAATGSETSPLFTGGHTNAVNACITLAAPHNGTAVASALNNSAFIGIIGTAITMLNKVLFIDFSFDQFGLTESDGSGAFAGLGTLCAFSKSKDHCGQDMSLSGSLELNKKIKTAPSVYYFSYIACDTAKNAAGNYTPGANMFPMFKMPSLILGSLEGKAYDGVELTEEWAMNDGLVPFASARYPIAPDTVAVQYSELAAAPQRGVWHQMPVLYGSDHYDFCTGEDIEGGNYNFFKGFVDMVNALPA